MLQAMQKRMQRQGIRRLLVMSGETQWSHAQARQLMALLPGDWPWVGSDAPADVKAGPSSSVKTLLGQERLHAVFDASQALDVEALAQLCGTLRAGSWLLLLVPAWRHWAHQQDGDSLRWSDCSQPIPTPNFIHHLQRQLSADSEVSVWHQGQPLQLAPLPIRPDWQAPQGEPSEEQQKILARLLEAEKGIWVLTAARGRGKSTLAGMLMAASKSTCWITGPSKAATEVAAEWSKGKAQFWAPDALLQHCAEHAAADADWLLVDEAAAIPSPLLQQLVSYFPRVLLTTTVQGYEGTGRGFLLKFCAALPQWQSLSLQQPMRWAAGDALERIIDNALLFNEESVWRATSSSLAIQHIEQAELCAIPQRLQQFYALLCSAHYRTSPLDLRRLMDAPGMHFSAASQGEDIVGALWLVDEGGLSDELAHAVWAGRRRPRGSLVAQSLAAHSGQWWAPTLRSRRITRIAVLPELRQQGVASRLIEQQKQRSQGLDFLSVSFGYTEALWRFWQSNGFTLVRIGNKPEASSGCHTAMALLPLSEQGDNLCRAASKQLARDWRWLQQHSSLQLTVVDDNSDHYLNQEDWRELAGFAFAHRPLEASLGALQRLLMATELHCAALRNYLQQKQTVAQCVVSHGLSGQKALLHLWRQETAQALQQLNAQHCHYWYQWSQSLQ
ncbi:tRNA(Met) cytidine acetyltransferase TmcA [Serratia sp. UGAL515B_01]|uniref:tRNA(Met) cytidine acetyltransferase TmcA n=1 Tax=Serratia sp. UGAL515B_01 TaxID=2986763 RepID=UPI002952D983|nr:GNAT family N-acetyltransferase [Serratia sp. UGAL515B_01]WON75793.1 GNAT family N-acetyltransferase [Serratia sp. UGAL515B_01]